MSKATQIEKILTLMLRNPNHEWWYAPDFQQPHLTADTWVGYEATARMSDLMRDYPQMVEHKRDGKYRYIKFRFAQVNLILANPTVASWVKDLIKFELKMLPGPAK
jgi:hypothetical protein